MSDCEDLGIYGSQLLYTGATYRPIPKGCWTRNPVEIERFTSFFDRVWNGAQISSHHQIVLGAKVTLSQLLAADRGA